jgi:hypothetical protein
MIGSDQVLPLLLPPSPHLTCPQIDIHPHDSRSRRGNTFLIGVVGQNDIYQDFSITVRALSPPPITPLLPNGYPREVTIRSDEYSFFSLPVDGAGLSGKVIFPNASLQLSLDCHPCRAVGAVLQGWDLFVSPYGTDFQSGVSHTTAREGAVYRRQSTFLRLGARRS